MIPKKPERKEHCDFCTQNYSFMSEYPQCNCGAFEHNLLVDLAEKREEYIIEELEYYLKFDTLWSLQEKIKSFLSNSKTKMKVIFLWQKQI